jgi:hypothetical protein
MGIVLASNFDVETALPLDSRLKVADTTERDAIDSLVRYEGMIVYVVADGTNYQLVGGITNGDWQELSGGGGAGGGGSLEWLEQDNAPTYVDEYFIRPRLFANGLNQRLFAAIKVPSSYSMGSPITMRMPWYSPSIIGTALFQTVTTLLNPGDILGSTANQRTSTNSAVDLSLGASGEFREVILDLTSTVGQINSVDVEPNALLIVEFRRGTDTSTTDLRALVESAEVLYE